MRGASGGSAIVVHRTLTTHANENNGGWHYHPGYVYNVVKSGTIAVQDGCDAEARLYGAGEAFETSEGRVHRAFVPKEPGKDAGKEDAVEENMFILPAAIATRRASRSGQERPRHDGALRSAERGRPLPQGRLAEVRLPAEVRRRERRAQPGSPPDRASP